MSKIGVAPVAASGNRFTAVYRVAASLGPVEEVAAWMAGEMTVEFPLELIDPAGGIAEHVVGRVEEITGDGPHDGHRVAISIACEVVHGSITQLLSVVWGNVSLGPGIDLVALDPPDDWPDPRPGAGPHGLARLREAAGAPARPMTMSAIKPLGLPVAALAAMAGDLAAGGLDIVKEDQSLADQRWSPFDDRVGVIGAAIERANDAAGTRALYAPSLNGPIEDLPRRARVARDAGAGAVMVQPGISGYPSIAAAASAGLPVIAHPGGFGGLSDRVAPALVHGLLPRMAGADCSIFITPGGRFDIAAEDAAATVRACLDEQDGLPPVLPAAGGGITVERVPELRATYGDDLCLLIGGDLHRHGDPRRRASELRAAVEAPA